MVGYARSNEGRGTYSVIILGLTTGLLSGFDCNVGCVFDCSTPQGFMV